MRVCVGLSRLETPRRVFGLCVRCDAMRCDALCCAAMLCYAVSRRQVDQVARALVDGVLVTVAREEINPSRRVSCHARDEMGRQLGRLLVALVVR